MQEFLMFWEGERINQVPHRQLIYVDGQLLAEGDYDNAVRISLTGFAVSQPENEIEKQIDGAYVTVSDDFYMG